MSLGEAVRLEIGHICVGGGDSKSHEVEVIAIETLFQHRYVKAKSDTYVFRRGQKMFKVWYKVKVKGTRLARKIYPKHEEYKDGFILVEITDV